MVLSEPHRTPDYNTSQFCNLQSPFKYLCLQFYKNTAYAKKQFAEPILSDVSAEIFSRGKCVRGKRYGLLLLNISISASKYAMASFMYGWIRGTMMAMKFSMPSSSTTAVLMT